MFDKFQKNEPFVTDDHPIEEQVLVDVNLTTKTDDIEPVCDPDSERESENGPILNFLRESMKWMTSPTGGSDNPPTVLARSPKNREERGGGSHKGNKHAIHHPFFCLNLCGTAIADGIEESEMEECRDDFLILLEKNRTIRNHIVASKVKVWDSEENEVGIFVSESVLVETEPGHQAPLVVVRHFANIAAKSTLKAKEPLPVILVVLPNDNSSDYRGAESILQRFARLGFLAVGVDSRFQGKRIPKQETNSPEIIYLKALVKAFETGGMQHPFLYDNVWDFMRVIDYLQTREDVDPSAIGATGVGFGGMHALFLAFADERIHAAAPLNAVHSFRWAIDNNSWQPLARKLWPVFEAGAKKLGKKEVNPEVARHVWSVMCPGILDRFDIPRVISAVAPRALLLVQGGRLLECPMRGVRNAHQIACASFAELCAETQLELYVEPEVDHIISETMWQKVEFFFVHKLKCKPLSPV